MESDMCCKICMSIEAEEAIMVRAKRKIDKLEAMQEGKLNLAKFLRVHNQFDEAEEAYKEVIELTEELMKWKRSYDIAKKWKMLLLENAGFFNK